MYSFQVYVEKKGLVSPRLSFFLKENSVLDPPLVGQLVLLWRAPSNTRAESPIRVYGDLDAWTPREVS